MIVFKNPIARAPSVPGLSLEPVLCPGGEPRQSRIHADNFNAALHQIDEPVAENVVGARIGNVVAPDHDAFWELVSRVLEPLFQPLRRVRHAIITQHSFHGRDSRAVAGVPAQCEHDIRAAVGIGEHAQPGTDVSAGPHAEYNAFGAKLLADLAQPLFNQGIRLFPRYFLPFPLSAFSRSLERARQTVGVVDILRHRKATRAEAALVPGVVRIPFYFGKFPFFDMRQNSACSMAAGTRRPDGSPDDFGVRRFGFHFLAGQRSSF